VNLFRKGWLGIAILCASSICLSPAKGIDAKPAPGNVFRKIKNDVRQPPLFCVTGFGEAVQKTSLMMGGVANQGGIFHTSIYIHRNTGFIIGKALGAPEILATYRLGKTSQGRPASDDRQEQRDDFYSVLSPPMCLLGGVVLMICGAFMMLVWLDSDRPGAIAMTFIGSVVAVLGVFLCFSAFLPPF
jgi:hypothetical protein